MDIKAFRGLSGTYNVRANERDRGAPRTFECLVQFLNNTQHTFIIDRRSKGQHLLDSVFKHLNLIETDFFGLKYIPQESHTFQNANNNVSIVNNNNNNIISSKTSQTLINNNSHDQSPSPNTSLSSSSAIQQQQHQQDSTKSNNLGFESTRNDNILNHHSSNNSIDGSSTAKSYNIIDDNNTQSSSTTLIEERWLDPSKSIRKQCRSEPPYNFYFRVKFYVSDPCKLADDTTRNHLYLQLRRDILNNRLIVPTCSAILLASYILQSEIGDYKREHVEDNYASNFRLLPNQSDDIKKKVIELHKQHKSLSSADAEYQFLEHAAKKLDCYGVEFYDARDISKVDVQIGVSSNGLVVFRENKRVNQFSWAKITKIMFKKKIFSIQLRRDIGENCDNFMEFNLLTNQACKSFWEECVAQHSFFRLHQPKSPPKKFFSFLNFGSKFQYSGKTEYQTMEESRKRSFSHFSRTPSKRYARRTIAIGRPSWSESNGQDSSSRKASSTTDECIKNHHNDNDCDTCLTYDNDDESRNNNIYSSLMFPSSAGKSIYLNNGTKRKDESLIVHRSVVPSSSASIAYRPKSLTLKSFLYIDESKGSCGEITSSSSSHHHFYNNYINNSNHQPNRSLSGTISGNDLVDQGVGQVSTNDDDQNHNDNEINSDNSPKKNLKRRESLRISDSIRGAIELTKKAGVTSSSQLARISESLRDRFLVGKIKRRKSAKSRDETTLSVSQAAATSTSNSVSETAQDNYDDLETRSDISLKIVRLSPGKDGKFGFKIREVSFNDTNDNCLKSTSKTKRSIIIYDVSPNSPAATCNPRLNEKDRIISINGFNVDGLSETKVENLIKNIQRQTPPDLVLEICSRHSIDCTSIDSSDNHSDSNFRLSSNNSISSNQAQTLADSIKDIKKSLEKETLSEEFEKLSRKKEDEPLDESQLMENIEKNRYRDILPYDSTRVQLIDSMTGDYINASFVDISVPSGTVNRYIATQGPLESTCDDFWQMVWEQNCSLIIMVTPLIEAGRVKCHKYWPDVKEETRYGQLLIRNIREKSKKATIDRKIMLLDVKSGEKRMTTQIQYKAWPDHEVPEDCSDFLKLVDRVRDFRSSTPKAPIVVHCSAGIGRTGVLILMETAVCIMESGKPIYPIKILGDMRKQRAMLIQTSSQFQFVAEAICKVYAQKLYKKPKKHRKK